jgi:hypothetical protein
MLKGHKNSKELLEIRSTGSKIFVFRSLVHLYYLALLYKHWHTENCAMPGNFITFPPSPSGLLRSPKALL